MTLLQALINRNFIEGVDFSLTGETLIALPKVRQIEQIIHHEAVEEVIDPETNEVITPAVAAYDETILADETYYKILPSIDELKLDCIQDADLVLCIEKILSQLSELRDIENDCFSHNGRNILRWDFKNIPQPSIDELYVLVNPLKNKLTIENKYKKLNEDVYGQMQLVFGTTNPESAQATYETWKLMVDFPGDYSSLGLKDELGNNLDNEQAIIDYANVKINQARQYSVFRIQKIKVFKEEKAQLQG